ncbi:hypothetical protein Bca101_019258 [Brassica carinata]
MMTGDLVNIHPTELKFPFELKKQLSSCSMQLTNKTNDIAGDSCNVTVTMQAQKEECRDKFLVQFVIL